MQCWAYPPDHSVRCRRYCEAVEQDSLMSDQYSDEVLGFFSDTIPGVHYLLTQNWPVASDFTKEGLLDMQTSLNPEE